jgi:hypothetical protein
MSGEPVVQEKKLRFAGELCWEMKAPCSLFVTNLSRVDLGQFDLKKGHILLLGNWLDVRQGKLEKGIVSFRIYPDPTQPDKLIEIKPEQVICIKDETGKIVWTGTTFLLTKRA